MLYPLFVHNIGALLYHPTNQARQSIGGAAVAARRPDQQQQEYMRTPQSSQTPSLTHHHTMNNPPVPQQPPHSLQPHPSSGRPSFDRAHTFPTPPTSASSLSMGMGSTGSSYEYGGQSAPVHAGQSLSNKALFTERSVPTSPAATTPPGNSQGMQYPTTQGSYDSQRHVYSTPSYSHYPQQHGVGRYNHLQSSPSDGKSDMGPPTRGGAENEHPDPKSHAGYSGQHEQAGDHEGEYTHTSASSGATRSRSFDKFNPVAGPIHSDPSQISPNMTHSPHQNGSGRATPRTANTYTGYGSTPQRPSQLPASNLNYVMSGDTRAGAPNGSDYGSQSGYQSAPQYPSMNGVVSSNKRVREVDDSEDPYNRPLSAGGDASSKRQRTDTGRPLSQPHSVKAGGIRR